MPKNSNRISTNAHIGPDCEIDKSAVICDGVRIASGVKLHCGVFVGRHTVIEQEAVLAPNACVADQKFLSDDHLANPVIIRKGAMIGANAVILPGIIIGGHAVIGAGAVVTRSVPPNAVVVGSPARIIGYVNAKRTHIEKAIIPAQSSAEKVSVTAVKGVTLHRFSLIKDMRGNLTVVEFLKNIPFIPKRYFIVFDVPTVETRGEHAHRKCHQFLICIKGSCAIVVDDGSNCEEFILDNPDIGIYLPPMVWGIQYKYSSDAILLVFASDYYDPGDYIRDYQMFISELNSSLR
jgi:UDP-2-acetamido-3-amino-2,3-dideoxy-glucuronate N-acetyltransferase